MLTKLLKAAALAKSGDFAQRGFYLIGPGFKPWFIKATRSGLVMKASDHIYSSASNYINGSRILDEVTLADKLVERIMLSC